MEKIIPSRVRIRDGGTLNLDADGEKGGAVTDWKPRLMLKVFAS
jgi:hypothetical protein